MTFSSAAICAAIKSAARNNRTKSYKKIGNHNSKEETVPLIPNRSEYEDIENPFRVLDERQKDNNCNTCFITITGLLFITLLNFLIIYVIFQGYE